MMVKVSGRSENGKSVGGRPPQTADQQEKARIRILCATREVFGEHGYHGVTVSRVLEKLEMSRPTFYRYFANADEAVRAVIESAGDAALRAMHDAVDNAPDDIAKALASIEAHLTWSREQADIAASLEAGLHDPSNPVSAMRERVHGEMAERLQHELVAAGRAPLEPLTLTSFITTLEHTSYHIRRTTDGGPEVEHKAREIMVKCALALLGTPADWRLLTEDPERVGLDDGADSGAARP